MKRPKITSALLISKYLQGKYLLSKVLLACSLLFSSLAAHAESLWHRDQGEITLPADYRPGYKPSVNFIVEQDIETGTFIAHPETQARFNRLWMNQSQDKTGKQAEKALLKIGAKALYKMMYQRSKSAKSFLPDEEGKLSLNSDYKKYKLDYDVHVRSSSLTLGMNVEF
ncbi:hypothetical protein IB286_04075 [Spongiibacter sp. KMU-158]|uniref:Uncharacterized protein n=1 Tax=Spongiibacter pelagi TaxID=2760804 RepID=A0A927C2A2_9GAMM|nr:hypothetical protein [Spongiibacter pelagi]MBD2858175.1 hypothetical protein [Spongiibacter pelagi]